MSIFFFSWSNIKHSYWLSIFIFRKKDFAEVDCCVRRELEVFCFSYNWIEILANYFKSVKFTNSYLMMLLIYIDIKLILTCMNVTKNRFSTFRWTGKIFSYQLLGAIYDFDKQLKISYLTWPDSSPIKTNSDQVKFSRLARSINSSVSVLTENEIFPFERRFFHFPSYTRTCAASHV